MNKNARRASEGDENRKGAGRREGTTPARVPRRVLLVDDHPLTRIGLKFLIGAQSDLEVCGEAGSAEEAFGRIERLKPDLVIADWTMPGRSGLEFVRDLAISFPETPVLVLSVHDEAVYAERAIRAGARGYIMKEVGGEQLLRAIRKVLTGQMYVSAGVSARLVESIVTPKPRGATASLGTLSDREFQVFQLIGEGKNTHEIAEDLHLSPKTVDVHRANIRGKLDLRDGHALIRYAVRWFETERGPE